MRVYLPASAADLAALLDGGVLRVPADRPAYAVTPAVCRALDLGPEDEEAEYAVLGLAAHDAVTFAGEAGRRVVVVCDVAATVLEDARVRVDAEVPRGRVQALHVDDEPAVPLVRAARDGDVRAAAALDDHDLGWWATQELDRVVAVLDAG